MGTGEMAKRESDPLRKVWVVNQTTDSNLIPAENLALLSDALHMQLELVDWEERIVSS